MMNIFQSFLLLLGRIFITAEFFWAGSAKIMDFNWAVNYMTSKGIPFVYFFLAGAIFLQIVGSLLLLTGYKARLGAWMLIIFIIPASIIFHDFWNLEGSQRLTEQIMFMKDLATLGGLFAFAAFGPGNFRLGN
jgi:putative oxidoreductase